MGPCAARRGRPVVELALEPSERRTLEHWAAGHVADARLCERAALVLACARGLSNAQAAAEVETSARVAGRWRRRFFVEGLWGLLDRPRPGAPARIDTSRVTVALELLRQQGTPASTRRLAVAAGISQSSASRLSEVLALDLTGPSAAQHALLAGVYAHGGVRGFALRARSASKAAPACAVETSSQDDAVVSALDDQVRALAALLSDRSGTVRLRRFLKQLERVSGEEEIDLVISGEGWRARAVQRWLSKHPRFTVHDVSSRSWWRRLLVASLATGHPKTGALAVAVRRFGEDRTVELRPFQWIASQPRR